MAIKIDIPYDIGDPVLCLINTKPIGQRAVYEIICKLFSWEDIRAYQEGRIYDTAKDAYQKLVELNRQA